MANITIKDSGYVSVNTSGTVFSGSDIVNSGAAVELKGIKLVYNRAANVEAVTEPDNSTDAEVNYVSYNNPNITTSGALLRGDLDGTGTDLDDVVYLDAFVKTRGIKCVYYNDSQASTSGYPVITKWLGESDSEAGHPTEKHFHVRFTKFTVTQDAKNLYRFTLEGITTK